LDRKYEDVFIYEALDGDHDNPVTYECWAILMSKDSFYGKQARSETAKVFKVRDRNMNSLHLP
jgi:uridine phosphorylase